MSTCLWIYFPKQKIIIMRRVALFYTFTGLLNVWLHGRQLDSQICCNSTCCTVSRKSHCMFMKEWKWKKANILLILLWKQFWLCKHPETSGEPWGVHKPQFESHCLKVLEWSVKDFPQQQNKIKLDSQAFRERDPARAALSASAAALPLAASGPAQSPSTTPAWKF